MDPLLSAVATGCAIACGAIYVSQARLARAPAEARAADAAPASAAPPAGADGAPAAASALATTPAAAPAADCDDPLELYRGRRRTVRFAIDFLILGAIAAAIAAVFAQEHGLDVVKDASAVFPREAALLARLFARAKTA